MCIVCQVLEMRYGTLRIRLETARDRLKAWANDDTGTVIVDELEEERINPHPHLGLGSLPTLVCAHFRGDHFVPHACDSWRR